MSSGQPDALCRLRGPDDAGPLPAGTAGRARAPSSSTSPQQNPGIAAYQACVGMTHLEAGDDEEALEVLERGAADGFASVTPDSCLVRRDGHLRTAQPIDLRRRGARAGTSSRCLVPTGTRSPSRASPSTSRFRTVGSQLLGARSRARRRRSVSPRPWTSAHRGEMKYAQAQTQLAWGRMLASDRGATITDERRTTARAIAPLAKANGYAAIELGWRRRSNALEATG